MAEPAVIRVIIKNKRRILVKEERRGSMTAKRAFEAKMRAIFYHSNCTSMHVALYNEIELKWKILTKYKH